MNLQRLGIIVKKATGVQIVNLLYEENIAFIVIPNYTLELICTVLYCPNYFIDVVCIALLLIILMN